MPFIQFPILMPFLYFPDDKTEYLPALLTMIGFFIVAVLAFILIKKSLKNKKISLMKDMVRSFKKKKRKIKQIRTNETSTHK